MNLHIKKIKNNPYANRVETRQLSIAEEMEVRPHIFISLMFILSIVVLCVWPFRVCRDRVVVLSWSCCSVVVLSWSCRSIVIVIVAAVVMSCLLVSFCLVILSTVHFVYCCFVRLSVSCVSWSCRGLVVAL